MKENLLDVYLSQAIKVLAVLMPIPIVSHIWGGDGRRIYERRVSADRYCEVASGPSLSEIFAARRRRSSLGALFGAQRGMVGGMRLAKHAGLLLLAVIDVGYVNVGRSAGQMSRVLHEAMQAQALQAPHIVHI